MSSLAPIFAADHWYQQFEFWGLFLTAVCACAGGAWFLAKVYFTRRIERLDEDRDKAKQELAQLEKEIKRLRAGPDRERLTRELAESKHDAEELQTQRDQLQELVDNLNRRLAIAQQMEGATWRVKPGPKAPAFVPLQQRRVPVIAVLNLKGGVGKTTLTANLGAAFARGGSRVLLVDLDLQASLTSLYIPGEAIHGSAQDARLVQHFFERATAGSDPALLDFAQPTSERGVEIIGSADTLAYAELNLTVHWLLKPGQSDPRLLLRRGLHGVDVTRRFDAVLIDCPPFLNISCVNALAAADYLLVPIMPSPAATERVAPMMRWISVLRGTLNPALKILGVAANRVAKATGMSQAEHSIWTAMRDQARDAWGEDVYLFRTFVPQRTEVRDAESERRPLHPGDESFQSFRALAAEVCERLPHASRPPLG